MIDPRFKGIVVSFSIIAAICGLIFGWVPGSDLLILIGLWGIGIMLIISGADAWNLDKHWFRHILVFLFVGVILSGGISAVQAMTLPIFWIMNPILDGIATYRILRSAAKLYAKRDLEENTSSSITILWSVLRDSWLLISEFFGLSD